jgi:branched-chain amino acid transport system substrate-binding protein
MIIPLTGSAAEFGEHERNAALLVQAKVREQGGINGRQLDLQIEDSQGMPRVGVNALHKLLLEHRPVALFSELSVVSLAIAPLAEKSRLVMFSIAASPDLTRLNRYAFRNFPAAERQGREMATHTAHTLRVSKVAIFYVNDDFGLSLRDAFKGQFAPLGGSVLGTEPFESSGKDFRSEIAKLISYHPQAIYIVGYGKPLGIALKQLREAGFQGFVLGGLEVSFEDVLTVARNAAEGVIYLDVAFDPGGNDPIAREFVREYRSAYGKTPSMVAAMAYDAISLIADAVRHVGTDPDAMRAYLLQVRSFPGACGTLAINQNRDVIQPLVMKQIQNGKPTRWLPTHDSQ